MAFQGGNDLARDIVSGSFAATGSSVAYTPEPGTQFNITLTGAGTAAIQLEASYDDGVTWCQIYAGGTQLKVWSYAGTAFTERYDSVERGLQFRLRCTAWTSAVTYRLSQ